MEILYKGLVLPRKPQMSTRENVWLGMLGYVALLFVIIPGLFVGQIKAGETAYRVGTDMEWVAR